MILFISLWTHFFFIFFPFSNEQNKQPQSIRNFRALRYFRIDQKDYSYFNRTLLFFDQDNKGGFTFPQFIVLMWNFLSCNPGTLAGWSFRIYFGGNNYKEDSSVSQDQVFHMLDVIYGISAEFDYHSNLNFQDNSTDRDVQQMRMLVKKIAGKDGTVEKNDFIKLVQKTPMLMMRIISAHTDMRKDCVGTGFWNQMEQQRKRNMSIESVARIIEKSAPNIMWKNGEGNTSKKSATASSASSASKYAVNAEKERTSHKKNKLDHEEDKAATSLQNAMRAKAAKRKVRKARAEKQKAVAKDTNGPWSEVWDPQYQANYYYNNETQACVWEVPDGFVST